MSKTTYIDCPFCEGLLEVDLTTGQVVEKWAAEEREGETGDKMTDALKKLNDAKAKRKDLFSQKKGELDGQKKKLSSDFEKEVEKLKKKGNVEKPFSPFDLD